MSGLPLTPQAQALLAAVLGPAWRVSAEELIAADGTRAPVRDGIARFREEDSYNRSFALQWGAFRTNQLDEVNGSNLSMLRFAETGWTAEMLNGQRVLEAGCGAGRFTAILARLGARLVALDYSSAVDVSRQNNEAKGEIAFVQADILAMPFQPGSFDFVFCHGVLQHTPDPERAFHALLRMVRPGGRLSADIYRKDGLIRPWKSKYLWRWWTTRIAPDRLLAFLRWFIPKWLPIDTAIKSIPYAGNYLGSVIPCWNYSNRALSSEQKREWAIMDTFDALAPAYDLPAHIDDVRRWAREAGLADAEIRPGGNGVVINAIKPL